jgi:DNA-binding NarL/FixJ family response regulator
VRVAILDDSALFRDGLAALLRSAGLEQVRTHATAQELLGAAASAATDVAVLDIRMPPHFTNEGLVVAKRLRAEHPRVGVLMLSTYAVPEYAAQVLEVGTRSVGYLLKDRVSDTRTLLDALDRIARGEAVIEPDIVQGLLQRQRTTATLDRLTERERSVLRLIAEGRSNAGIARELFVHVKTVEHHIRSVFDQLGLAESPEDNRRVLATLEWLREST